MAPPRRTGGDPKPTPGRPHGPGFTPPQLSSFVGREGELAEVGDLLGGTPVPARARRPDRRGGLWAASEDLVRPYLT